MSRLPRLITAALLAAAASACATMSVSSHAERGMDFTAYKTFAWGPADQLPTGDPRLDNDPFFKDHVEGAAEKQLALKGFELAASAERADLLIHYHASINRRIDVNRIDSKYGGCYGEDCVRVVEYEAGTLVVDIVDARTRKVIWRGWAQDAVQSALENQDRMAGKIDEAVTRMLALFPAGAPAQH